MDANQFKQYQKAVCQRKRAYDTFQEAREKNTRVYRCGTCGKWHRSGSRKHKRKW